MKTIAIHEARGQDVTLQCEIAYSLVTGGGKPGQGYPCVIVIHETNRNDSRPPNAKITEGVAFILDGEGQWIGA